jgi:hypothetical protein
MDRRENVMIRRCAVRAFARWVDDPTECPLAFDLILDRDTGRICGNWPIFGACDADGADPRPFFLDATGILRFGADRPSWRTDLRQLALAVGVEFRLQWTDQDFATYEIVKIAALGGKKEKLRFLGAQTDS